MLKAENKILVCLERFGLCSYASLATSIKTSSPIGEWDASELCSSSILVFCWVDRCVGLDRLCLFIVIDNVEMNLIDVELSLIFYQMNIEVVHVMLHDDIHH